MTTSINQARRAVGLALCLAFLLIGFAVPQRDVSAAACTTTLPAGADIGAAIAAAAPGDVICLSAGAYTPAATLVINKALTLQGPQSGIDPRPSAGSARVPGGPAEAIITGGGTLGTLISIESGDVSLDGFEIANATGDMIASPVGGNVSNVALRNLIIHDATGDEGMQIRDCDTCFIEYNYIYDTFGDGINVCCDSVNVLVQFNELKGIDSENAALYVYGATETTLQCNLIYDTSINEGIKLGSKNGADHLLSGGSILYNVIHHTAQDGIAVYMSDVDVMGNDISYSNSENGAIYLAQGISDVSITYNTLHDNILQTFKWGNPGAVMVGNGGSQSAATIQVANNNIEGNLPNGVTNWAAGALDAQNNWWGAADGPSGVGPGGGDAVSTNVDFDPWLTEPAIIPPSPCLLGGTIEIVKAAGGGGDTEFTFDVSWSDTNIVLKDGESEVSGLLPAGYHAIEEIDLPDNWSLEGVECVNGAETGEPAAIPMEDGDEWVCTFTNVYTPPITNTCSVDYADNVWTDILGIGMGNTTSHKVQAKVTIPDSHNLVGLYGQMVGKEGGAAKYVRFILPGKGNYVQVDAITSPVAHQYGNFWYGAELEPAKFVNGRWFLQPSGFKKHLPRALVLYPTYTDPAQQYVNVWSTYGAAEGEVYWDVAQGWTPARQIELDIPAPLAATTFNVELALVDNDKDARPVYVTVSAGGVSQTQQPAGPNKGNLLNILSFTLANVPAGTDEIVIDIVSPVPYTGGLGKLGGDSATVVGAAANYLCEEITPVP